MKMCSTKTCCNFLIALLSSLSHSDAAIFTHGEFPTFLQNSYFNNITCSSHASESSLEDCDIYEGDCLPICQNSNIGIRCFRKACIIEFFHFFIMLVGIHHV